MLYTTYYNLLFKYKETLGKSDIPKIAISLTQPQKFFKLNKVYVEKKLAPTQDLLNRYKNGIINFEQYIKEFENLMQKEPMKSTIERLKSILNNGIDIILVCYEKDNNQCHRKLIADYLSARNYGVEELIDDPEYIKEVIENFNYFMTIRKIEHGVESADEFCSMYECLYRYTNMCDYCERNKLITKEAVNSPYYGDYYFVD